MTNKTFYEPRATWCRQRVNLKRSSSSVKFKFLYLRILFKKLQQMFVLVTHFSKVMRLNFRLKFLYDINFHFLLLADLFKMIRNTTSETFLSISRTQLLFSVLPSSTITTLSRLAWWISISTSVSRTLAVTLVLPALCGSHSCDCGSSWFFRAPRI